ncbi:unnamed protein product [Nesidiocoris tenuis]|uniref:Uncharacterized protein n=1 Tax=Nesidiocoris tenuis TaxID=355587 RepID=A0A6H5GCN2_9HEMI|nr:unnamed protein product [Nesidiocoris tenuis]
MVIFWPGARFADGSVAIEIINRLRQLPGLVELPPQGRDFGGVARSTSGGPAHARFRPEGSTGGGRGRREEYSVISRQSGVTPVRVLNSPTEDRVFHSSLDQ